MQTRTYQALYNYVFGKHADILPSLTNTPSEHKEKQHAAKIEKIKKFFIGENSLIAKSLEGQFRETLRQTKATNLETILFGNATDKLESKPTIYEDDQVIKDSFQEIESEHHFFSENPTPEIYAQYQAYYYICAFTRDFIENEPNAEDDEENEEDLDFERAYKMLVLFGDHSHPKTESKTDISPKNYFKAFDNFIKLHGMFDKPRPLHYIFMWQLPKKDTAKLHMTAWRQIIQTAGRRAIRLFSKAPEIEASLSGNAPKNFQEAFEICKTLVYKNLTAAPELANLCMHYDISEDIFNRCLEIQKKTKTSDNLPNIIINGEDKEIDKPGYYLAKLPIGDPRAYLLGHITDCCQSIGGHSEKCVIDGITRQHNGFYVLLKEKKKTTTHDLEEKTSTFNYANYDIIGQGYAWLSLHGNLTFDSWENLRSSDNLIIIKMLTKFAAQVVNAKDSRILRVTIGCGGKTPKELTTKVEFPEMMHEGYQYPDSKTQNLIYCNTATQEKIFAEYCNIVNELFSLCSSQSLEPTSVKEEKSSKYLTKNTVFSYAQLDRINAMVKNPDVINYFKQIDIRQNYEKDYESGSYYHLLETLSLLNEARICTPKNIDLVVNYCRDDFFSEATSSFFRGITELHKAKLLTIENFEIATSSIELTLRYASALIKIRDGDIEYPYPIVFAAAIEYNHTRMIDKLLDSKVVTLDTIVKQSYTPIKLAINLEKTDVIKLLLSKGVDIQSIDAEGNTLLHFIVSTKTSTHKNVDMLKILIAEKANIHHKNNAGNTPFQHMLNSNTLAQYSYPDMIKILVEAKTDINTVNNLGHTPLITAVGQIHSAIPNLIALNGLFFDKEQLLKYENYELAVSKYGNSPFKSLELADSLVELHEAKALNSTFTELVIARASITTYEMSNALSTLSDANLLNHGNIEMIVGGDYGDGYDKAIAHNEVAELIVKLHKNIDSAHYNYTAILFKLAQCRHNSEDLIKKLIQSKKADIDAIDRYGDSIFMLAIANKSQSVIKILLEEKVNLLTKNNKGTTTLHKAIEMKSPNLVKQILEAKADVNANDNLSVTPLITAIKKSEMTIVKLLLDAKANPEPADVVNPATNSPIQIAFSVLRDSEWFDIQTGKDEEPERIDIIKTLITAKANIESVSEDGFSVLTTAVMLKNTDLVQCVLAAKADINAQPMRGFTALQYSLTTNSEDIISLLLSAKADPDREADQNRSARQLAEKKGSEVSLLFRRALARNATQTTSSDAKAEPASLTNKPF